MAKRLRFRKGSANAGGGRGTQAKKGPPASLLAAIKREKWPLLQSLLIIAAGLWVFWPAVHGQWIGDDSWYLADNPLMNDPARVWKAWFQPGSWVEYYPIEESVQWVQWQLWHDDTFGYHLTNIILHVLSALLVWRLLGKFGLPLAWLGGLLFVVHPMMVDSVALINELKASLSLPPFLLALCAWVDYEEHQRKRDYGLALTFFIVAMLCKITMAMFPFVILLYAWWKRRRIGWNDFKASAPFFAVSIVLGMATIGAGDIYSHTGTFYVTDVPRGDALWRWVLAGENIAFYFSRCFLPVTPLAIYPQWKVDPHSPVQYLPWVVLGAVVCFLWTRREGWGRHALLGLGFFLVMLAPFWGLHWISYMNATWALDHLLYIPILGLIGLVVAGMGEVERRLPRSVRPAGIGMLMIVVGLLAWESHGYAKVFQDEGTSAIYILRHNPDSAGVHNNLGVVLAREGKFNEAAEQFEAALQLDPRATNSSQNLGNALLSLGRVAESIAQQQKTVELGPQLPQAHRCLADSLMRGGRVAEAIAEYREAVRLDSGSAWMHYNLGLVLSRNGQIPEAIEEYEKALALHPDYAEAHNSLGIALFGAGRTEEARKQFEEALRINPNFPAAQFNLAKLEAADASSATKN